MNNINKIIQAIPTILNQAKGEYVNDDSIIEIAKMQGVDLKKVVSVINQYENNFIVNNVARHFGIDIRAVKNKIESLIK